MNGSPWSARSIKTKFFGPIRITCAPNPNTTGNEWNDPPFTQIDFPTWARFVFIQTVANPSFIAQRDRLFLAGPRTLYSVNIPPPIGGGWAYDLPGTFIPPTSGISAIFQPIMTSKIPVMCRSITLLNVVPNNLPFATFALAAELTDIPRDAMPEIDTDNGAWATYNGLSNDPT